jgi:hypothetical protein
MLTDLVFIKPGSVLLLLSIAYEPVAGSQLESGMLRCITQNGLPDLLDPMELIRISLLHTTDQGITRMFPMKNPVWSRHPAMMNPIRSRHLPKKNPVRSQHPCHSHLLRATMEGTWTITALLYPPTLDILQEGTSNPPLKPV